MTSSSIFPDLRTVGRRIAILVWAATCAWTGKALNPDRSLSQYIRNQWGIDQGFPGGTIFAISQTADGYLWIGGEKGLIRFDGFTFRLFTHREIPELTPGPIQELTADANGDLWIRQQSMKLLRYRDGVFQDVLKDLEEPQRNITAMYRTRSAKILLLAPGRGLLAYGKQGLETLSITTGLPNFLILSMAQSADGRVWMGARDAGLFALQQGRIFEFAAGLPDRKINALLALRDGGLWVGTDYGLVRTDGVRLTKEGVPTALAHAQILTMLEDKQGNHWVGTSNGLVRVDPNGAGTGEHSAGSPGTAVRALFEDREGSLWVGTDEGLERLRDNAFITYVPAGTPREASSGPIYVDPEGRVWSAPSNGGLLWQRGADSGRVTGEGLGQDQIYSIAGRGGELWAGRRQGGLTQVTTHGGIFVASTYTQKQGLAQDSVYAVHQSRDGTVWAGTVSAGLSRFKDGKFTTFTKESGLASNVITSIAESPEGTMWFATPDGLSEYSSGRWRIYAGGDGLPPGDVNCLYVDSSGVLWIGTSSGLAVLRSGKIEFSRSLPRSFTEEIVGIEADRRGHLWLGTSNRVLRVESSALLNYDTSQPAIAREYGLADGLAATSVVKRQRSIVSDGIGRIWISTTGGISVIDPERAMESAPTIVRMQSVTADGRFLGTPAVAHLPARSKRIAFTYVGLCLSVPERIRFRYKLDDFDREWSEATSMREAVYTNLNPGSYRFHVAATNADGLWNSSETSIELQVEPVLWQTWWFRVASVLGAALATGAIYRFRLKQITRQLQMRFEERLSERTRIAQDLHDTLLQGILSVSMHLHVGMGRLENDSAAERPLSRALELTEQASRESRAILRGLRSGPAESEDLEKAFSLIPQELNASEDVVFRVMVEGRQRTLAAAVREGVYWVGREALLNAFRHARATSIELELEYAANQFRLLVRDNGCGIDSQVVESGRHGHWGLSGMRERAQRIRAEFNVLSSAGAGTEVVLCIPSRVAFQSGPGSGWRGRLFRGKLRA